MLKCIILTGASKLCYFVYLVTGLYAVDGLIFAKLFTYEMSSVVVCIPVENPCHVDV